MQNVPSLSWVKDILAGTFTNCTPPQINLTDLHDSSYVHVFTSRVGNSVDPDQLASQKPADLDLHCFQNRIQPGLVWKGLRLDYVFFNSDYVFRM